MDGKHQSFREAMEKLTELFENVEGIPEKSHRKLLEKLKVIAESSESPGDEKSKESVKSSLEMIDTVIDTSENAFSFGKKLVEVAAPYLPVIAGFFGLVLQ